MFDFKRERLFLLYLWLGWICVTFGVSGSGEDGIGGGVGVDAYGICGSGRHRVGSGDSVNGVGRCGCG